MAAPDYSVVLNPNGTVTVVLNYPSDIHGNQSVEVVLTLNNSGKVTYLRTDPLSSAATIILPDESPDSSPSESYPGYVKALEKLISAVGTVLVALSFALLALGLIAGKMIGVEMMAVLQIAYFALMPLSDLNPCFSALTSLRYVNGYNQLNDGASLQNSLK
jgi:hypothetical protein